MLSSREAQWLTGVNVDNFLLMEEPIFDNL